MYCFLDDLLTTTRPKWARPADKRRRLSDAQVLTTALVAARYFGGNLVGAALHGTALGAESPG